GPGALASASPTPKPAAARGRTSMVIGRSGPSRSACMILRRTTFAARSILLRPQEYLHMQVFGCYTAGMRTGLTETELRAWQALLHAHHHVTRKLDAELRQEHGLSFGD